MGAVNRDRESKNHKDIPLKHKTRMQSLGNAGCHITVLKTSNTNYQKIFQLHIK